MKIKKIDILIAIISLSFFGYYNTKSILASSEIIKEPVYGMIIGYENAGNKSPYLYKTDKNNILNSYYFFDNSSDLNLDINDYILKYPHSLDLFVLKQGSNGLYRVDKKIIGSIY